MDKRLGRRAISPSAPPVAAALPSIEEGSCGSIPLLGSRRVALGVDPPESRAQPLHHVLPLAPRRLEHLTLDHREPEPTLGVGPRSGGRSTGRASAGYGRSSAPGPACVPGAWVGRYAVPRRREPRIAS